ncbi:MAG TPA: AEC family transporter [Stellaceae bacterium]|nr:AEC family transporter [Stellaceae bacterium]
MANLLTLFVCLAAGVVLRRTGRLPENSHSVLNTFIINISLPALTLAQIHGVHLQSALAYSVAMPWAMFILGAAFFWTVARLLKLSAATTGGLMLVGGLANTSFVGLPMIEAFYGHSEMAVGIVIDQLGTYLVLSTLGIAIAAIYSEGAASAREIAKRIVTFPPLLALLLAVALYRVDYPGWLSTVLVRLGDTLAPLALVSVGFQLRLTAIEENGAALAAGLAFKLCIAPLLLTVLYVGVLRATGRVVQVTLFESAMGPQIGGSIIAIQYGLNPPLVTLMVGIGIALSFLTAPMWWYLLASV